MTCHHCKKEKVMWAFATFRTRRGALHRRGVCKECRSLRVQRRARYYKAYRKKYNEKNRSKKALRDAQRRAEVKAYVDRIKASTPCADCKRKFPAICMDFDHVKGKTRNVSGLVSGAYRLALIKEEIVRCELVCSCCHRIRTQKRKDNLAPVYAIKHASARRDDLSIRHVQTIRTEVAAGEPVKAVARRFGIPPRTVRRLTGVRTGREGNA